MFVFACAGGVPNVNGELAAAGAGAGGCVLEAPKENAGFEAKEGEDAPADGALVVLFEAPPKLNGPGLAPPDCPNENAGLLASGLALLANSDGVASGALVAVFAPKAKGLAGAAAGDGEVPVIGAWPAPAPPTVGPNENFGAES